MRKGRKEVHDRSEGWECMAGWGDVDVGKGERPKLEVGDVDDGGGTSEGRISVVGRERHQWWDGKYVEGGKGRDVRVRQEERPARGRESGRSRGREWRNAEAKGETLKPKGETPKP